VLPVPPLLPAAGNALDIRQVPLARAFASRSPELQACRKKQPRLPTTHYLEASSRRSSSVTWSGWRHLDPRRDGRYGNRQRPSRRDHAACRSFTGIKPLDHHHPAHPLPSRCLRYLIRASTRPIGGNHPLGHHTRRPEVISASGERGPTEGRRAANRNHRCHLTAPPTQLKGYRNHWTPKRLRWRRQGTTSLGNLSIERDRRGRRTTSPCCRACYRFRRDRRTASRRLSQSPSMRMHASPGPYAAACWRGCWEQRRTVA